MALDLTIRYAVYDHHFAAVFNDAEAYVFNDTTWNKVHVAEIYNNAGVVSKAAFDRLYPNLPPLPKDAFLPTPRTNG